jgi:hypothetical protein
MKTKMRPEEKGMKAFLKPATLVLIVYAFAIITNSQTANRPTTNDVKIRQRMSTGAGNGIETLLYIKGPRMRTESAGAGLGFTTILQCDLKRTLTINEKTKTYLVSSTENANAATSAGDAGPTVSTTTQTQPQRGGVVNVTHTINDTGERKEMFGFTARHIKTSIVKTASPDACDKDQQVETDGWYIDFQYAFECPGQTQKYQPTPVPAQPGCKDEIRTRTVGTAKLGFPVLVTTTVHQPDGRTSTMTQEVLELTREPLSASLFDVPDGYALAKDMQQLYGIDTSTASTVGPKNTNVAANPSTTTTNAVSPGSEKKPGVIRIGLILPVVQLSSGNAAQTAEVLRNSFASYLKGPNIEVVTLAARLPSLALDEARQSQCDYILSASMTIKKGGGGGSMFGRAIGNIAGSAAGHIPGGGSATTGAARSAAITGVYTTAAIASSIKARDEASLEYKLDQVDPAKSSLSNKDKAKASADGEDIVAPLVQKAAEAIVAVVRR